MADGRFAVRRSGPDVPTSRNTAGTTNWAATSRAWTAPCGAISRYFYIDVRDQQLTIFPEGQSTGRMMTNAGRTRSVGAEAALQFAPWRSLEINMAYGYTDARFVRYDNGIEDFKDNRIPTPRSTPSRPRRHGPCPRASSGSATWSCKRESAARGASGGTGEHTFAALLCVSERLRAVRAQALFARHLGPQPRGARYDVFYFKSIGNEFVQRGRPRTFGITLNINI